MKFNRFCFKYILPFLLVFVVAACDFGDTNIDPDNPADAPQESLLPSAQAHLAFAMYGDASRYAGHFTQHLQALPISTLIILNTISLVMMW